MASGKKPEQNEAPDSRTFAGRINASVSGVARSAFTQPSAATDAMAFLSNGDGKEGSSSMAPSTGELPHPGTFSQGVQSSVGADHATVLESFRSGHSTCTGSAQNTQAAFNAFLNPSEVFLEEVGADSGRHLAGRPQRQYTPADGDDLRPHPLPQAAANGYQPESNDGAAVVALLSEPSLSTDEKPGDTWSAPMEDQQYLSSELSSGQRVTSISEVLQAKPLDMIPSFTWFGHTEPALIAPWNDILNRYHDEVWGDALPLVQEARQELKEAAATNNWSLENHSALRRLGMLLLHLKPPNAV
ncbi:MAG: hypothetical protein Q9217_001657 [Psora testacea]